MNIKSETINGVTRYTVNGTVYERLEDVPEEYRKHFQDKNNNGIPDQLDNLFSGKGTGLSLDDGKQVLSSVFDMLKDTVANPSKAPNESSSTSNSKNNTRYNRMSGESSALPTLIKVSIGIVIGIIIAWFAIKNFDPGTTPEQSDQGIPITEEASDDSSEPVVNRDPNALTLEINDPNEPPYQMYVAGIQNQQVLLTFNMPEGELLASTDTEISTSLGEEKDSNLNSQIIGIKVSNGACDLSPVEETGLTWQKQRIGTNEFYHSIEGGSGAGQNYSTHYYSLLLSDHCITFSFELKSAIATEFGPEYNADEKVAFIEKWLMSVKLSESDRK